MKLNQLKIELFQKGIECDDEAKNLKHD